MLVRRIEQIRQASVFGIRPVRIFREAATRFLEENTHLATLRTYPFHLKEPDPYIGELPLYQVHMGTLQTLETRKILLGHQNGNITTHYSAPELEELIEAANRVCEGESGRTPALVVLRHRKRSAVMR